MQPIEVVAEKALNCDDTSEDEEVQPTFKRSKTDEPLPPGGFSLIITSDTHGEHEKVAIPAASTLPYPGTLRC